VHVKQNWPVEYECSECLSVDVLGYDHQWSVLRVGKLQRGNQRLSRGDLTFTEQYQSILELTLRSCIQADRQQPWASCSHHIHVSWNSHFAPVYKQTDNNLGQVVHTHVSWNSHLAPVHTQTATLGKLLTSHPCVLELTLGSRTYTDSNLGQVVHTHLSLTTRTSNNPGQVVHTHVTDFTWQMSQQLETGNIASYCWNSFTATGALTRPCVNATHWLQ